MFVQSCNPCSQEPEAGGFVQVREKIVLQREPKASLNCIMRFCLKNTKKRNTKYTRYLKNCQVNPYSWECGTLMCIDSNLLLSI